MEVLGIDIGFGFTKATNGKDYLVFKSLMGEATDIQFRTKIGSTSYLNDLHVTIDDKSYFIGDFAEQQSNVRQFTLDQEKLISDFVKILGLTVAGTFSEEYVPINLVSGLPVGYLKQYYKRFAELLSGHHKVTYHNPDGSTFTRRININKIRMMPQPLGSLFNMMMNDDGKIINADLSNQKVGVVDIGFRTTDFTIMDRMRYVERGSSTMDTGISKSFAIIANKLREESGVAIELYRLFNAVEGGTIKIRGQEYNIANLRDQVYQHSAGVIAGDIDRLWAEDWDIDVILVTGGGSRELANYLEPMISGQVIHVENNVDARLNNVQGFYKYGRYEWRDQTTEIPETATAEEE